VEGLVLDASLTVAAILPEGHSEAARSAMARFAAEGPVVPSI
jgi:hypothetical protein